MGYRSTTLENGAKPIEPDTVLAMASCTKLMTAISVLQCVERGLFQLDEDVGHILPELKSVEIISDPEGISLSPTLRPKNNPVTFRYELQDYSYRSI